MTCRNYGANRIQDAIAVAEKYVEQMDPAHIVYFYADKTIQTIQGNEVFRVENSQKVFVNYDTKILTEDGRQQVVSRPYEGIIIYSGDSVPHCKKILKLLKSNGTFTGSHEQIIDHLKNVCTKNCNVGKRGSSARFKEVMALEKENMQEDIGNQGKKVTVNNAKSTVQKTCINSQTEKNATEKDGGVQKNKTTKKSVDCHAVKSTDESQTAKKRRLILSELQAFSSFENLYNDSTELQFHNASVSEEDTASTRPSPIPEKSVNTLPEIGHNKAQYETQRSETTHNHGTGRDAASKIVHSEKNITSGDIQTNEIDHRRCIDIATPECTPAKTSQDAIQHQKDSGLDINLIPQSYSERTSAHHEILYDGDHDRQTYECTSRNLFNLDCTPTSQLKAPHPKFDRQRYNVQGRISSSIIAPEYSMSTPAQNRKKHEIESNGEGPYRTIHFGELCGIETPGPMAERFLGPEAYPDVNIPNNIPPATDDEFRNEELNISPGHQTFGSTICNANKLQPQTYHGRIRINDVAAGPTPVICNMEHQMAEENNSRCISNAVGNGMRCLNANVSENLSMHKALPDFSSQAANDDGEVDVTLNCLTQMEGNHRQSVLPDNNQYVYAQDSGSKYHGLHVSNDMSNFTAFPATRFYKPLAGETHNIGTGELGEDPMNPADTSGNRNCGTCAQFGKLTGFILSLNEQQKNILQGFVQVMQETLTSRENSAPVMMSAINQQTPLPEKTRSLAPLIVDPNAPDRFESVLICRSRLRELLIATESRTKSHAEFLLNGLIDLVCEKEELATSNGLGLRGAAKDSSLSKIKVDAIREFVYLKCKQRGWDQLNGTRFTRIFTNKMSNARRDQKKIRIGNTLDLA